MPAMPSLIAILSAVAIAGGFGALVGLLVSARGPRPASVEEAAEEARSGPTGSPHPSRPARKSPFRFLAPASYVRMLEHRLVLAGRPAAWTVDKLLMAKAPLTAAAVLLAGLWAGADPVPFRIVPGAALVMVCFFLPDLLVYNAGVKRQEEIQLALPDTLDQMTISVEAGLGFSAAMGKAAAGGKGPLAEELVRTLQDISIGRSRADAYLALAERTTSPDLRRFSRAIVQADSYGVAVVDALRVQAAELRLRRRQRAEQKARAIPVKVLFPLVFCILPVMFIVLLTPAALRMIAMFS